MKEKLGTKPVRLWQGIRVIQEQMRFASIEAMQSVLNEFRDFYNHSRPHQSLRGQTPASVWNGQVAKWREKKRDTQLPIKLVGKRQAARASPSQPQADQRG